MKPSSFSLLPTVEQEGAGLPRVGKGGSIGGCDIPRKKILVGGEGDEGKKEEMSLNDFSVQDWRKKSSHLLNKGKWSSRCRVGRGRLVGGRL